MTDKSRKNINNKSKKEPARSDFKKTSIKRKNTNAQPEYKPSIKTVSSHHTKEAIFWIGSDASFYFVNDAACSSLGYTQKELLNMKVFDIDPNFNKKNWDEHWDQIIEEKSFEIETVHKRKDKTTFPVAVNINYLEFGDKEYNVAYARDITIRKMVEEALKESEDKFRDLSEKNLLAIFIIQDGYIKYANEAASLLVGLSIDELMNLGKNEYAQFVHPEDRGFAIEQAQKKMTGDPDVVDRYSFRLLNKDGEISWVDIYSRTVEFRRENADFVSLVDITERHEAEEVLQKAHDELEFLVKERTIELTESNRQLKRRIFDLYTIFELSRNFNAVLNYETLLDSFVLTSMGQMGAAKAALYLPKEVGDNEFQLVRVKGSKPHPKHEINIDPGSEFGEFIAGFNRPIYISELKRRLSEEKIYNFGKYFPRGLVVPLIFQTKLRGVLVIAGKESGVGYRDEDIEFLSILANQTAVSIENARLYESEKEALVKLQEAQKLLLQSERLALLGEVSAKVAHEVNNPLSIIKNYLQLLQGVTDGNDKASGYVDVVREEIDRIAGIVKQLLNMGKPAKVKFVKTNIADTLRSSVSLMNRHFQNSNINVTLNLPSETAHIMGWPDGLKQVFLNLLINAGDAIGQDGQVKIDMIAGDHKVQVLFEDNGPGIKPEHIPHIFEPFYSTKNENTGTGLGLSVCQGIIRSHNGTIEFRNTNEGGCFKVELPIEQEESEDEPGVG